MTEPERMPAFRSNAYLFGLILANQNLLLRLASLTSTKEDMLAQGTAALETLRIAAIPNPISDDFLQALDDFEEWLLRETS